MSPHDKEVLSAYHLWGQTICKGLWESACKLEKDGSDITRFTFSEVSSLNEVEIFSVDCGIWSCPDCLCLGRGKGSVMNFCRSSDDLRETSELFRGWQLLCCKSLLWSGKNLQREKNASDWECNSSNCQSVYKEDSYALPERDNVKSECGCRHPKVTLRNKKINTTTAALLNP